MSREYVLQAKPATAANVINCRPTVRREPPFPNTAEDIGCSPRNRAANPPRKLPAQAKRNIILPLKKKKKGDKISRKHLLPVPAMRRESEAGVSTRPRLWTP